MACAAPVVASPQASSALHTVAGRDLLMADNPPAFATTILQLLDDPARCAAIGAAGRHYVEQHHSWDAAAQQLEELYQLA
jgi:polysaccharide biosynthesis protein PslH